MSAFSFGSLLLSSSTATDNTNLLRKKYRPTYLKTATSTEVSLLFREHYAVVDQSIFPGQLGRIYYQSTYWFGYATADMDIPAGSLVEVLSRQGTTWLVRPIIQPQEAQQQSNQ